jgi:hypothetical protein
MPIDCIPPDNPALKQIRRELFSQKEMNLDFSTKEIVKTNLGETIRRAIAGDNPGEELTKQADEISELFKQRFDRQYIENAKDKYLKELDVDNLTGDVKKYFEERNIQVNNPEALKETLDKFVVEANKDAEATSAEKVMRDRATIIQQLKEQNLGFTPKSRLGNVSEEFAKAESDFLNARRRALGYPYERATLWQRHQAASMLSFKSLMSSVIGDIPNFLIHQPIQKLETGNVFRDVKNLMPEDLRANMGEVVSEARGIYHNYGLDTGRSQASKGSEKFQEDPSQYGEFLVQRTGRDRLEVDGQVEYDNVKLSFIEDVADAYSNQIFKWMGETDSVKSAGINRIMDMNVIPQKLRDEFDMTFDPKNRAEWDATYEVMHTLANEPFITDRNATKAQITQNAGKLVDKVNQKYDTALPVGGSKGRVFANQLIEEAYDVKRIKGEEIRAITHQGQGLFSDTNRKLKKTVDDVFEEQIGRNILGLSENQAKWLKMGTWFNLFLNTASNMAQTALDTTVYGPMIRSLKAVADESHVPGKEGVHLGELNWGKLAKSLRKGKWHRTLILQSAIMGMASLVNPEDYLGEYPIGDQREQELMRIRGIKPGHIKLGEWNIPISHTMGPLEPQFRNIMELRKEYQQRGEGDTQLGLEMLWVAKELNKRPFTDPAGEALSTADRIRKIAPEIQLYSFVDSTEKLLEEIDKVAEGESPTVPELLTVMGTSLMTRFVPNEVRDLGRVLSETESRRSHQASEFLDSAFGLTWGEEFMGVDFMFGGMSDARINTFGERLGHDKEFSADYLMTLTGEMLGFPREENPDDPLVDEITRLHVVAKEDVMPTPYIENIESELPEIEIGDSSLREELQMMYGKELRNEMLKAIYQDRHSYIPRGTNITLEDRSYEELPNWVKAEILRNAENRVKQRYINDEGLRELRERVRNEEEVQDFREEQEKKF